jgi:hypothetical protein
MQLPLPYYDTFRSIFDYLAEAAFGASYLALFIGALYFAKDGFGGSCGSGWYSPFLCCLKEVGIRGSGLE